MKFKIVTRSVGVFFAFICLIMIVFFQIYQQRQLTAFDLNLYNHAIDIARSIDVTLLGDIVVTPQRPGPERKILPFSLGLSMIQLRDLDGRVLLTSPPNSLPMPFDGAIARKIQQSETHLISFHQNQKDFRAIVVPIERANFAPLVLQVAAPTAALEKERNQLLVILSILFGVSVLAVAGVSYLTVNQSLSSVYRIINAARSLQPSSLSSRLPLPEETELKELGTSLNELLNRIHQAFQSQEQFSADASHQLKTPLAILRTELDLFQSRDRTPEETREMIQHVSQGLVELTELVDNLLLLARFDSGSQQLAQEIIRVDEVLLIVISQLQFLAGKKNVQLELKIDEEISGESLELKGDEDLLKVLFMNLIENAIKHSSPGQKIEVQVGESSGQILVRVKDQGSGIEEQDLSKIFNRFHRAGNRQHQIPGAGLGLAIAKRIADLHQAQIGVQSQKGVGTTFTVEIKKT